MSMLEIYEEVKSHQFESDLLLAYNESLKSIRIMTKRNTVIYEITDTMRVETVLNLLKTVEQVYMALSFQHFYPVEWTEDSLYTIWFKAGDLRFVARMQNYPKVSFEFKHSLYEFNSLKIKDATKENVRNRLSSKFFDPFWSSSIESTAWVESSKEFMNMVDCKIGSDYRIKGRSYAIRFIADTDKSEIMQFSMWHQFDHRMKRGTALVYLEEETKFGFFKGNLHINIPITLDKESLFKFIQEKINIFRQSLENV